MIWPQRRALRSSNWAATFCRRSQPVMMPTTLPAGVLDQDAAGAARLHETHRQAHRVAEADAYPRARSAG